MYRVNKKGLIEKKSGTWELDKSRLDEVKNVLEKFKDKYWNVIGDDIFYDGIDSSIHRLEELKTSK